MEVYGPRGEIPDNLGAVVLTLGNFDGVHMGHRELLCLTRQKAKNFDVSSVVMTFDPHPLKIFNPEKFRLIQPLSERVRNLSEKGLDICVVLPFNKELYSLSPEEFVKDVLLKKFDLKEVIIGFNTTFGKGRAGTPEIMAELGDKYGFKTTIVKKVDHGEEAVSSSRIRRKINKGDIESINRMLGYNYSLSGLVVKGKQMGGPVLGFPTANIKPSPDLMLPKIGVYAVWVTVDGKRYKGALNIGNNPTFGEVEVSIEVFILDFNDDVYGEKISLDFVHRLRDEKKFDSIDALKEQMNHDVEEARRVLG